MCKPVIQVNLVLVYDTEPSDEVMQHAYRGSSGKVEVTYPVENRNHDDARRLAAREGADWYYFCDILSVTVVHHGRPVILSSGPTDSSIPLRVFRSVSNTR